MRDVIFDVATDPFILACFIGCLVILALAVVGRRFDRKRAAGKLLLTESENRVLRASLESTVADRDFYRNELYTANGQLERVTEDRDKKWVLFQAQVDECGRIERELASAEEYIHKLEAKKKRVRKG